MSLSSGKILMESAEHLAVWTPPLPTGTAHTFFLLGDSRIYGDRDRTTFFFRKNLGVRMGESASSTSTDIMLQLKGGEQGWCFTDCSGYFFIFYFFFFCLSLRSSHIPLLQSCFAATPSIGPGSHLPLKIYSISFIKKPQQKRSLFLIIYGTYHLNAQWFPGRNVYNLHKSRFRQASGMS